MKKIKDFKSNWVERLKDNNLAAEYLNQAIKEGDRRIFLIALREVAEAHGGLSKLAREANLNRSNLYKMLSKKGRPEIQTLEKVLETFGLQFTVTTKSNAKNIQKAA